MSCWALQKGLKESILNRCLKLLVSKLKLANSAAYTSAKQYEPNSETWEWAEGTGFVCFTSFNHHVKHVSHIWEA